MLLDATMEGEKGEALYQHKLGDICKSPVIFFSIQYKRSEKILEEIFTIWRFILLKFSEDLENSWNPKLRCWWHRLPYYWAVFIQLQASVIHLGVSRPLPLPGILIWPVKTLIPTLLSVFGELAVAHEHVENIFPSLIYCPYQPQE